MGKHTLGPWKAGKPAWFRGRTDETQGKIPISSSSSGVIANVYGIDNATLIAAAPDLLNALKMAHEDVPGWVEIARSAINKAEGV